MSDPSKAVFLSYASQDAEAAKRICDALRTAGVEVWFDQSELVGGDAWDQKIRKQIKDCALFMPVISAATEARTEGYFRIEWRLADRRMEAMGKVKTFLLPVCIDDTREAEADVPDSFTTVQWTRLPPGGPTPEFVQQVRKLLSGEQGAGSRGQGLSVARVSRPVGSEITGQETRATSKPTLPRWTWGALTAVVVGLGIFFAMRPAQVGPVADRPHSEPKPAMVTIPVQKADKSIAVLPFANLSEEKDSAFFADGIHEDILTHLAHLQELRVVSRTSVQAYRDTRKPIGQIARELGVTFILEGSVRRAGNKVRVTGQLIKADTDEHLWAKSFDRDLSDIFAIQAELAQAIAAGLQAVITPAELAQVERRPTENLAAYDLYLRGRDMLNQMGAISIETKLHEVIGLAQRAVALDPGFVRAWGLLAGAHSHLMLASVDTSEERTKLAWTAVEQVEALAPDSLEAHEARRVYYYSLRDYARAGIELDWVLRHYPRNADAMRWRGFIQRRLGRWSEALVTLRQALELDPRNITTAQNVALHFYDMRRYEEARTAYRHLAELRPGEIEPGRLPAGLATLDYLLRGSTAEGEAHFAALSPAELEAPDTVLSRKFWALLKGDLAAFEELQRQWPVPPDATRWPQVLLNLESAKVLHIRGAGPAAIQARLRPLVNQLRTDGQGDPANPFKWMMLGLGEALLGEPAAAIRDALRAVELAPVEKDAFDGENLRYFLGVVYAWAGEPDRALQELERRLRIPPAVSTHGVRHSSDWWPLRDNPRFQALIDDPKNNAPLY